MKKKCYYLETRDPLVIYEKENFVCSKLFICNRKPVQINIKQVSYIRLINMISFR